MLSIEKVTKRYEGVQALNQVSLKVPKGMIKGLMGPNGAGKSTLFHLISGIERPDSGRIYFEGRETTSLAPHEIALLGLGRTFQTIQTWGNMTVVDTILAGMHRKLKGGFLSCGFWLPGIKRQEKEALKKGKRISWSLWVCWADGNGLPRSSLSGSREYWRWGGPLPWTRGSFSWMNPPPD